MTVLDRIESLLGRFAVRGLIRYIVMLNALVYLLVLVSPEYQRMLTLDRAAIFEGQVWRLVTWVFLPNTTAPLWILFFLWFTWFVGDQLESIWGTFRLNAYYIVGYLACTGAALVFGASGGNFLLTLSLLLALATLAPDLTVLLLVIPIKLKWLALISLAWPWGLYLVAGPLAVKAIILVCLGNYLLFFGPYWWTKLHSGTVVRARRESFRKAVGPVETLHRCEVCGITEVSNPEAEFRVAKDGKEYCTKHLPG